ncbi:MAG: hypothetical protein WCL53_09585 [Chloroflexota bacterium]
MKYITGFAMFWWDFIVGDSIALAIGGIAVLLIAFGLVRADQQMAVQLAMPLIVIATLAVSLLREDT